MNSKIHTRQPVASAGSPHTVSSPAPRRSTGPAGLACCLAAGVLVIGCAVTQVAYATTTVPDHLWRYPWSSTAFIVTTILWSAAQSALVPAILAFTHSGVAGSGRAVKWGRRSLVIGAIIGPIAHLASLPFTQESFDENLGAQLVAGLFGIGALLSAVGFVTAGVGTAHNRRWTGPTRWVPLAIGACGVGLLVLQFTPALPAAVGVYYLGFVPLGIALLREQSGPSTVTGRK